MSIASALRLVPASITVTALAATLMASNSDPMMLQQQGNASAPQSEPPKIVPPTDEASRTKQDGAEAQAVKHTTTLETIVVSSEAGVPLTYPGGRDVIEPETKERYPDGSIDTVLRRIPGVSIQPENGNDSRINIAMRGADPRRSSLTTVMVDGIPVCEAPYGNTDVDGLPIAFDRIWRTDVIRGGGSIRYGPNGAGGIVNFLTEPVPYSPLLRLGSRIGSDSDYAGSLATGGTWGPWGVLATGVIKGGDGFRENGEYQDYDGAIKLRYALSPTDTLSAYISRFTELQAEQPGGLSQADYDADPDQSTRHGADFSLDMNRYVVQYTTQLETDSQLEIKGWYQEGFRRLNDFRPILSPFTVTRQQNSDFNSSALEASFTWSGDWLGVKHSLIHSARVLHEENDEYYVRRPIGGGPPILPIELNAIFKGDAYSLFAEDLISIAKDVDWGIGFRGEIIEMNGKSHDTGNDLDQDYNRFLPETNITWKFRPEAALYASYQEGFYPPQYETGFDPASVLYAPTSPESSHAFEVGLRSRELEGLQSSVALFDTEFHDKIDFINTPAGKVPVNTGHARAYGVEVGANYDVGSAARTFEGLSVYGTITAQRSRIESGVNEGNETPNAPELLASWGGEYDIGSTGLWARIGGSYTDGTFRDPANTPVGSADGLNGPVPSFTLWDCAIGWDQHPDHSGFSLSVGVTNLFDEEYFRRFATGIYPGAPRQAFAAISYQISL